MQQPYIHQIAGRLRVRSTQIKQSPQNVEALLARLQLVQGINTVYHKRYAGSVTVLFEPEQIDADTLLAVFDSHELLSGHVHEDLISRLVVRGSKLAARTLLGLAAQQLLGPRSARILAAL